MNLPPEIFGDVIVVHTPEELGAEQCDGFEAYFARWKPQRRARPGRHGVDRQQGLTALLNVQDMLREKGGDVKIATSNVIQPQDPGNHPPGSATRSVRQRRRRREEFPLMPLATAQ